MTVRRERPVVSGHSDEAADGATIEVRDLGRMSYADALAVQRSEHARVVAARESTEPIAMVLLLVEHDPAVITVSRRPGAAGNLLAGEALLRGRGVEVAETDRGGDITLHGPGQLVSYPIVDLNRFGLRIGSYMRLLEQVVIDVVGRWGIRGEREEGVTGVWVEDGPRGLEGDGRIESGAVFEAGGRDARAIAHGRAKIAAMGVRVSRWVSMHGLALNVDVDLSLFDLIVPCGLAGRRVTSMRALLGAGCPGMGEVKGAVVEAIGVRLEEARVGRVANERRGGDREIPVSK